MRFLKFCPLVAFLGDIPTYKRVRPSLTLQLSMGTNGGIDRKYHAYTPRDAGMVSGRDMISAREYNVASSKNAMATPPLIYPRIGLNRPYEHSLFKH
jgi:hypothetical protein